MSKNYCAFLTAATIAVAAGFTSPVAAIEYPWCAQYAGGPAGGGRNCAFTTYAQCMETSSGMGGFCEPNLFYTAPSDRPAKRPRKYRGYD
jgi:hypothetical protein